MTAIKTPRPSDDLKALQHLRKRSIYWSMLAWEQGCVDAMIIVLTEGRSLPRALQEVIDDLWERYVASPLRVH